MKRESWFQRNWYGLFPVIIWVLITIGLTAALYLLFRVIFPLERGVAYHG